MNRTKAPYEETTHVKKLKVKNTPAMNLKIQK